MDMNPFTGYPMRWDQTPESVAARVHENLRRQGFEAYCANEKRRRAGAGWETGQRLLWLAVLNWREECRTDAHKRSWLRGWHTARRLSDYLQAV